jgi:hypothetical protein
MHRNFSSAGVDKNMKVIHMKHGHGTGGHVDVCVIQWHSATSCSTEGESECLDSRGNLCFHHPDMFLVNIPHT